MHGKLLPSWEGHVECPMCDARLVITNLDVRLEKTPYRVPGQDVYELLSRLVIECPDCTETIGVWGLPPEVAASIRMRRSVSNNVQVTTGKPCE